MIEGRDDLARIRSGFCEQKAFANIYALFFIFVSISDTNVSLLARLIIPGYYLVGLDGVFPPELLYELYFLRGEKRCQNSFCPEMKRSRAGRWTPVFREPSPIRERLQLK